MNLRFPSPPFAWLRSHGAVALALTALTLVLGASTLSTPLAAAQQAVTTASHSSALKSTPWWKHAVIYEIYPRSFQDSNGDGIGDLNGITSRLGYLQSLGVNAIWIAPMYPSPQVDFGYDISNYEAVDPQYGTMADMDHLIAEGKQHHVRVILDMVLNHTSNQSPWFIAASSSRTNPKHDWYIWNDGLSADAPGVTAYQKRFEQDGRVPPNNWVSTFGGSAWQWVPAVHQFYYHEYYKQQPDLNWRNPAVEKAMFDAMRFWLDRGVAGFRLDSITTLYKDPLLRNNPVLGGINAQGDPNVGDTYTNNLPEVHDIIRRMRAMAAGYPGNRVLIGETYLPNIAALDKWYGGAAHNELQLPMDMILGFHGDHDRLDADTFRRNLEEVETQIHGSQPLIVFDNHDNVRSIDRYGDGVHDDLINKELATMLFTVKATALMYYGEELGMHTHTPTRRQDVRDPIGITGWPKEKGRDGERTPMQWTPGPQAGFSTNPHTWLPIPPDYKTVNVEVESRDPNSQLNWFKQLIALRRNLPALHNGAMTMLNTGNHSVLSYLRSTGSGPSVVVAMNFTAAPQTISLRLPGSAVTAHTVKTLATDSDSLRTVTTLTGITLPPYTSWVASVE